MIFYDGLEPSAELLDLVRTQPLGGITLMRRFNVQSPAQVRALTGALQQAARDGGQPPLLVGIDQEGGQLMAISEGTTPFPGNLALGAAGSDDLAYRAGAAMATELAALGVNIDYAPVCDVNLNPLNPVVGTRSFGEDPYQVSRLAVAMIAGIQSTGLAATAKHFPGHGDTATDSHYNLPVVPHDLAHLRRFELPPFEAAIQAGVKLVMTSHLALPAVTGRADLPATLSAQVLDGLLRRELGFTGVIASDALDMHAIEQGPGLVIDLIAAVSAGIDLLLMDEKPENHRRVYQGLLQAARRMLLSEDAIRASARRVLALKQAAGWIEQPGLDQVGCRAHRELAYEIACRSVTLVRDRDQLLPLRLAPEARLAVLLPQPQDLTPADTSSAVQLSLAQSLRRYHPQVEEYSLPLDPSPAETGALLERLAGVERVIAGTINAGRYPGQAALVNALLERRIPTVAVALRMPYDLQAYPAAPAYACTYSILPPALDALADALFGRIPFAGRLPVSVWANKPQAD